MIHTLPSYGVKTILDALDDAGRHAQKMLPLEHETARQVWFDEVLRDLKIARNRLLDVALVDVEIEAGEKP